MGRHGASLLLALGACLLLAVTAAGEVEVSTVSGRQTAAPGDFVTTVFEVRHQGSAPETYDLALDLPSGLVPLAPPRAITLAPDESERLFISINVTRRAQAGESDVTLTAVARSDSSIRDSATGVVAVETSPSLAIRSPGAQQVLPDETVTFRFVVVNRGNVVDRAVLDVRSLRDFPLEVSPSSAELMPGETIDVDVRVAVPDGADPGRDRVTLTARSATFETVAAVTVDLTVLPPAPRDVRQDLSLQVPSLWRINETSTDEDPVSATTSVTGDARFGTASRFRYAVEITDLLDVRSARVQLERPQYGVTLGDLTTPLSELVDVDGRGAEVALTADPDTASGLTLVSARNLETAQLNVGARAALQGGNWVAALAGRRDAEGEATVAGVSLLRLPLTAPALIVEGALSRDPPDADSAFLVRGNAAMAPFTFDGEFLRAGPTFIGSPRDELRVALEPGVAFDDAEVRGILAWERDGLGTNPTQTGTAETRVGAVARVEIAPLPTILAQADYETDATIGTPKLVDISDFTAEARASKTFGPLTIGVRALRELARDRLAGTAIARSQWRTEAELRLESALLAARLGMTTDVDVNAGSIDDRFLTALLRAEWRLASFGLGFEIARDRNETRFQADLDGTFGRWTFSSDGQVILDDDDPTRFELSASAGLDFRLPISFIQVKGQVEGHVFVDANGNGIRDADENGVSGLRLSLNGAQARTDDGGFYRFPPVDPGTYELTFDALPATLQRPTEAARRVTLRAGRRLTVDMPLIRVAGIRTTVFDDADEDGARDDGEAGLRDVRVTAVGPDGQSRSARTGTNGVAEIGGLRPGAWRVAIDTATLPESFELTTNGQASVDLTSGERADVSFGAVERPPEVAFSPTAEFSFQPDRPRVGERVRFDASDSFDPDGTIVEYEWDFDEDGSTDARGRTVEHVFDAAGERRVTLTVTDDDGLTGSQTRTITVRPP